jgi:hypothetical protein
LAGGVGSEREEGSQGRLAEAAAGGLLALMATAAWGGERRRRGFWEGSTNQR